MFLPIVIFPLLFLLPFLISPAQQYMDLEPSQTLVILVDKITLHILNC